MRAPLAFFGGGGAAPSFDPATLSPDGWWRGSFVPPLPWLPTAPAAGNLVVKNSEPVAGPAKNGIVPARFDGVTRSVQGLNGGNFVSAVPGFTIVAFFQARSLAADAGNFDDDPAIFTGSTGNWALTVSAGGVRGGIWSGTYKSTARIALAANVWAMAAMRWTSTSAPAGTIDCRVSQPSGTVDAAQQSFSWTSALGTNMYVGQNYNGAARLNFDAADLLTFKRPLSNAELNSLRLYFNARYAAGLT